MFIYCTDYAITKLFFKLAYVFFRSHIWWKTDGLKTFFVGVKPDLTHFRTSLFMYALLNPQINLRWWFNELLWALFDKLSISTQLFRGGVWSNTTGQDSWTNSINQYTSQISFSIHIIWLLQKLETMYVPHVQYHMYSTTWHSAHRFTICSNNTPVFCKWITRFNYKV